MNNHVVNIARALNYERRMRRFNLEVILVAYLVSD